ncbi:hypothetical protein Riv7116_4653 [Rivularia sp. PCC 7116]|uniref:hypothetical protein n=1 Tax=Rivularia sp. PCC 7116 TaxID=373994 RepID=UPI00029EE5E2|nr:hypothetical protein [Rivularia sp. PCC 7116]AFY57072.1 hypothetical protein Riv7116_4653 [Rivularia sp. PCC 7116]
MPPKITNSVAWQQAELLMQPTFIRVIDNVRKILDNSSWKGTYHDVLTWAAGTSEETKAIVTQMVQELETATPEQAVEIRETLAKLPTPHPGYHLCLERQDQQVNVDLWELCYQVCFVEYTLSNDVVDIDTSLLDETGDVEWNLLDKKAKRVVEEMFAKLPH